MREPRFGDVYEWLAGHDRQHLTMFICTDKDGWTGILLEDEDRIGRTASQWGGWDGRGVLRPPTPEYPKESWRLVEAAE